MRFLSLALIFMVLIQYKSSAKGTSTDTIIVDLAFEKPDFYVYHIVENKVPKFLDDWNYLFSDPDKSKLLLKRTESKKPFTGVLIIQNPENREQFTCPFYNGIPHGVWQKHTHNWNNDRCGKYSLLVYAIPIQMGFPNGEGKMWPYNNECEPKLSGVVNYEQGKPMGYYYRAGGYPVIEGNFAFGNFKNHKNFVLKYGQSPHGYACADGINAESLFYFSYLSDFYDDSNEFRMKQFKCTPYIDPVLRYKTNQPSFDVYVKDSLKISWGKAALLKGKEYIWENGSLIKFNKYHWEDYLPKEENYLEKSEEYEYYCGYTVHKIKERINHKVYDGFFRVSSDNYKGQGVPTFPDWEIESLPKSSFELDTFLYIDYQSFRAYAGGLFKHGYYTNEWKYDKIEMATFEIPYYLAEGEYYFGEKTGTWKYYIFIDRKKVLIGTVDYKIAKKSSLSGFISGKDFCGFCDHSWTENIGLSRIEGKIQIYNLDGTVYLGYEYVNNQPVRLIKKAK